MTPVGFRHIPGFLGEPAQAALLAEIRDVIAAAPLYQPRMPRTGKPFSVQMTNCGTLGWVSDAAGGYRYQAVHPETGQPWPSIPQSLLAIWDELTGAETPPEACLINWYAPGAKLGLHVDADEMNRAVPVVSLSLGDDAWFRIGGPKRRDPSTRLRLGSGDAVVLGGAARLAYHGIDRIIAGTGTLLGEPGRLNLTLRRVNL